MTKILKNIMRVTFSNITTVCSGVIVSFLLPKIFSLSDYGFFKTFTLYVGYIGLFSLGIIDGISLQYGGDNYEDLDKRQFRSYYKWYMIINLIFACIIIVVSQFLRGKDIRYIGAMFAIDLIGVNISNYFQQISQITQRFREYSMRRILYALLKIIITLGAFGLDVVGYNVNYRRYILLVVIIDYILAIWYVFTYKELIVGQSKGLSKTFHDVWRLSKIGFPLLFSNFCSLLIMALDRQFVSILFPSEDYAIYAFAYNMLSLVTVATSAISTVLYPILKRTDIKFVKNNYAGLISVMMLIVFGMMFAFFPLCCFLKWFLPNYIYAIVIFRIIFPGLAISSTVTVIMQNYYKVSDNSFEYFKKCVVVLIISAAFNCIAYYCLGTMESISIASIITMYIWYVYMEQYFVKYFAYNRRKNLSYMSIMIAFFYVVTDIDSKLIGAFIYFIGYLIISIVVFKNIIHDIFLKVLKKSK